MIWFSTGFADEAFLLLRRVCLRHSYWIQNLSSIIYILT